MPVTQKARNGNRFAIRGLGTTAHCRTEFSNTEAEFKALVILSITTTALSTVFLATEGRGLAKKGFAVAFPLSQKGLLLLLLLAVALVVALALLLLALAALAVAVALCPKIKRPGPLLLNHCGYLPRFHSPSIRSLRPMIPRANSPRLAV